jgi:NitT/TauT family transport system permease protein
MATMTSRWSRRELPVGKLVWTLLPTGALLVLWQISSSLGWVDSFLASSPTRVLQATWLYATQGTLWADLVTTGRLLGLAFVLSVLAATVVGLVVTRSAVADAAIEPFVWFFYNAPTIAFIPLFMLWFGLGAPTALALGVLLGFFPMYASVVGGIRSVEPVHLKLAKVLGHGELRTFRAVLLPGSLPHLMAGLRLSVGRCFVGIVAGEIFAASSTGLGFRLRNHADRLQVDASFAALLVIALVALALGLVLRVLDTRCNRWRTMQ